MGYGVTEVEISRIMPKFEELAGHFGFFVGVLTADLERIAGSDLFRSPRNDISVHESEGFIASGTYQGTQITVPVKFY